MGMLANLQIVIVRPLHERYDGLKWLEFPLFLLKTWPIARLLPSFLAKIEKITLIFLSSSFHAKVS